MSLIGLIVIETVKDKLRWWFEYHEELRMSKFAWFFSFSLLTAMQLSLVWLIVGFDILNLHPDLTVTMMIVLAGSMICVCLLLNAWLAAYADSKRK